MVSREGEDHCPVGGDLLEGDEMGRNWMLRDRLTLAISAVPGERLEELELGIRGSCFCAIGTDELGCGREELS